MAPMNADLLEAEPTQQGAVLAKHRLTNLWNPAPRARLDEGG